VSEGCRNCYAERTAAFRQSGGGRPYEGLAIVKNGEPHWTGKIAFIEKHLLDPLKWGPVKDHVADCLWLSPPKDQHGFDDEGNTVVEKAPKLTPCDCPTRARRIFVNSMSDLFHENVTDEMRDKIFAVMALCPQHDFQVLTKRPKRVLEYLRDERCGDGFHSTAWRIWEAIDQIVPVRTDASNAAKERVSLLLVREGLSNIRLGVSVENQKAADDRLDYLCSIDELGWPTMVSFEPLLSSVDPGPWWLSLGSRTWAIVGGESGPGARPMDVEWARGLRDQCQAAGVPFFFKQWGEYLPPMQDGGFDRSGAQVLNSSDATVKVGKHAAGSLLDGVEWKQFPEVGR
jgi:protein gp37